MNTEKNIIRFSLNHKYNNYKILFNKLNEENKRKVELSEQLKELSPRMQMKLNELVEIKSKILESKNLSFNYEETKMYFLITLKMLSNLNLKYKVDENLFYKGNPMNFNSILAKEINNVALNIDNNKVDIDDFISTFLPSGNGSLEIILTKPFLYFASSFLALTFVLTASVPTLTPLLSSFTLFTKPVKVTSFAIFLSFLI